MFLPFYLLIHTYIVTFPELLESDKWYSLTSEYLCFLKLDIFLYNHRTIIKGNNITIAVVVSNMTIEVIVPRFYSNIANCYNKNLPYEINFYIQSPIWNILVIPPVFILLIQISSFLYHLGILFVWCFLIS